MQTVPWPLMLSRKALSFAARYDSRWQRSRRRFMGRMVLDAFEVNAAIGRAIRHGLPFMVSRLGSSELGVWRNARGVAAQGATNPFVRWASVIRSEPGGWDPVVIRTFVHNAGFFAPDPESLARYARELSGWLGVADMMAIWYYRHEDQLLRQSVPGECQMADPMGLEAYAFAEPWTLSLEGRRVLVVHPFAESIQRQFQYRHRLFAGKEVLPNFDLQTVKAVQTIAGTSTSFPDWFAALDSMRRTIATRDFDVAIIGAGAYGLPLAAYVKQIGKQAVHLGGSTQVLFGIKGRRWDDRPEVARYYNDYWVRPSKEEVPVFAESVEQGCYW